MSKPLKSRLDAKVYSMTPAQKAKLKELKKKGWIDVTPPEDTWNGGMMMEAPDGHYFIMPNGKVRKQC